MSPCPSELKLEAFLLGAAPALAEHVDTCPRCKARLDEMRRLGMEFVREVYPATVDAVCEAARPRALRSRLIGYLLPLAAAAAATGALFALLPSAPPGDYVGAKGASLTLTVFVQAAQTAHAVADGERVPADAALRFRAGAARPCRLWLLSVDGGGQVSRLFPATGEAAAEIHAAGTLPGGALLDGRAGPERIYAVCTPRAVAFQDLARAARESVGTGEDAVRAAGALRGIPGGAQATLLVEKVP